MSKRNYKEQSGQPFFVSANQSALFYFAFKISMAEIIVSIHIWHQSEQLIKGLLKTFHQIKKNSKNLGLSVRLTHQKNFFRKKL